ncbi:MAG: undecaprenyl-diphosphate phosphatase [Gemmatimonadaceae bacterium]|nr:undecaprenyl-diphosphate phosphatase [Gloeobacterales cyanobacterium ES-bin-141]
MQSVGIFEAIVLGLVQGITEYLPISSTAHLRVVPALLGWGDPGTAYTAVIQLGSLFAVVWYFWKDLVQIATGTWRGLRTGDQKSREVRLFWCLILGTLPIVVVGLALKSTLEAPGSPLRALTVIATSSIVMALLLWVAEKRGSRARSTENIRVIDGILIGFAQALALIPGVSRSGSTLTAALFLGFQRAEGARFSFLLGIPAIFLSGVLELRELVTLNFGTTELWSLIVGLISSTIFSYLAIAWLLKFLQTQSTVVFVIYRLIFAATIFTLLALGLVQNIEPLNAGLAFVAGHPL